MLQWSYYTYWSNLPAQRMETTIRPDRGWGLFPTNDDLTLLVVGWPYAESTAYKNDVEANYLKTLELSPEVADGPYSVILDQVSKGVAVRMGVLILLAGSKAAQQ